LDLEGGPGSYTSTVRVDGQTALDHQPLRSECQTASRILFVTLGLLCLTETSEARFDDVRVSVP
jgi:hypothetical protein